jgi:hypothetical protein
LNLRPRHGGERLFSFKLLNLMDLSSKREGVMSFVGNETAVLSQSSALFSNAADEAVARRDLRRDLREIFPIKVILGGQFRLVIGVGRFSVALLRPDCGRLGLSASRQISFSVKSSNAA